MSARSSRGDAMNRRVPSNPKFAGVRGRVDSGATKTKVQTVSNRALIRRKNEVFFRVSASQLHALLSEYTPPDEDIRVNQGQAFDYNPKMVVHEAEDAPRVDAADRPYLVIDVRGDPAFREAHVLQAHSFPQRLLLQDRSTRELHHYRNREGALIVLYDDDQASRLAAAAAQTLVHRGFENVYVLDGGIEAFARHFPAYVEGDVDGLAQRENRQQQHHNHNHRPSGDARAQMRSSCSSSASRSVLNQPQAHAPPHSSAASSRGGRSAHGRELVSSGGRSGASSHRSAAQGYGHSATRRPLVPMMRPPSEAASRMSEASVADSVISMARRRKDSRRG